MRISSDEVEWSPLPVWPAAREHVLEPTKTISPDQDVDGLPLIASRRNSSPGAGLRDGARSTIPVVWEAVSPASVGSGESYSEES